MYHCYLHFYLAGSLSPAFDTIRSMPPLEHFSHEFEQSDLPDVAMASRADVIFYQERQDGSAAMELQKLLEVKRGTAQVIVLAGPELAGQLAAGCPGQLTDIWPLPMTAAEARFRFLRWQQSYRARTDLWMAEQYLETTINSIPGLIWYKDKEGIHRKVNDSFCHAVGKTKQQVEGRDHYYIWDVDPNDPENAGNDCEESDRKVMESRRTCISEETVMTGDGMRLMTTYKSPLYDLDGSVIGTAGVGIDVTQERTYEKEIITKNRALEALFTSIDCGVLCHSLDGKRILSVNRAALEILGYESEEEMLETGFDMVADSVLDEDKERMRACIQSLKHVGDSTSVEYRVCHSDGELVYVLGNIKLQSQNGELFYQRFLVDCTEQKLQEKRNERHQAELVQALSIDYNVVCFFKIDNENGIILRIYKKIIPALETVF